MDIAVRLWTRWQLTDRDRGYRGFRPLATGLLLAGLCTLWFIFASVKLGMVDAIVPAAIVAAAWIAMRPALALALFLGITVFMDSDPLGFLPQTANWYSRIGSTYLFPCDLAFGLVVVAVALDLIRRGARPRLPRPFTFPLALVVIACIAGCVTGYFAGWNHEEAFTQARGLVYLAAVPLIIVNIVTAPRHLTGMIAGAVGLAGVKAVEGIGAFAMGAGRSVGSTTLTYWSPAPNWIMLLLVLGVAATLARRLRVPNWVLLLAPLALTGFLLSFRRSFWIGGVVALLLVLVLAGAPARRRLYATIIAVIAVVSGALIAGVISTDNSIFNRVATLSPSALALNSIDTYRFEEAAQILANVALHPMTGLGFGVDWAPTGALSQTFAGQFEATHNTVLWWLLKTGPLGVAAYLGVMAAAFLVALRVYRRHPDVLDRSVALTLIGGFAAAAVVELFFPFTGVDLQYTVVFGAALGWLAVASEQCCVSRRSNAGSPEVRDRLGSGGAVAADLERTTLPVPIPVGAGARSTEGESAMGASHLRALRTACDGLLSSPAGESHTSDQWQYSDGTRLTRSGSRTLLRATIADAMRSLDHLE